MSTPLAHALRADRLDEDGERELSVRAQGRELGLPAETIRRLALLGLAPSWPTALRLRRLGYSLDAIADAWLEAPAPESNDDGQGELPMGDG